MIQPLKDHRIIPSIALGVFTFIVVLQINNVLQNNAKTQDNKEEDELIVNEDDKALVSINQINGSSMLPNYESNQIIAFYTFKELNYGDVVLFDNVARSIRQIGRIIGLPGDEIQCLENKIYINGKIEELTYEIIEPSNCRDNEPIKLGEDEHYILGDNRPNSLDSRDFGPIKKDKILGVN